MNTDTGIFLKDLHISISGIVLSDRVVFDTQMVSDAGQFPYKKEKENLISTSVSFRLP